MKVWKVVHTKDGIETVYLVNADTRRQAETVVLDSLYERSHPVDPPYTPEELANDPFGLKQHVARNGVDWTNYALCKQNGCSINATPWSADEPYRLYSLNTKTGAMS